MSSGLTSLAIAIALPVIHASAGVARGDDADRFIIARSGGLPAAGE